MQSTLEPRVQLPTCITLAPRRASAGLSHAGVKARLCPLNHEEGKRGSGPWGGEGPAGPDKGCLGSRSSPVLLPTDDRNRGRGRKGEQGKGQPLEPLPLAAPPQGPCG